MGDRKRKRGLCFGVLGMVLCMAADWLLDVMPAGNVSNVLMAMGLRLCETPK